MVKSVAHLIYFVLFVALILCSCKTPSKSYEGSDVVGDGIASWYGPGFHGNVTANGETYDQSEMTAAHRTLPFNSIVRVVNLENGKTVDVRINDRGPNVRGSNRIIDLSKAAAEKIDITEKGLGQVRLILVRSESEIPPDLIKEELFTIQIASLTSKSEAITIASRYEGGWVQYALIDEKEYYRVCVGKYSTKTDADEARSNLRRRGINGFVKQVQN